MDEPFAKESNDLRIVAKRCERIAAMLDACGDEHVLAEVTVVLSALADVVEKESVALLLVAGRIRVPQNYYSP